MAFFYSHPAAAVIEAIAEGDYDQATAMFGDWNGEVEDYLANQQFVTLTATLDGAGAATIAHGLDLTAATVLLCQAFYDGGGGQSKPQTVSYVDASNVVVAGGGAAAACRVTLVISVGFISF